MIRVGWIVVVCLCMSVSSVLAQTDLLTQEFDLADGYQINLPAHWTLADEQFDYGTAIVGRRGYVVVYPPADIDAVTRGDGRDPRQNSVTDVLGYIDGGRVRPEDVRKVGGLRYPISAYDFTIDDGEGVTFVVEFGEGLFGAVDYVTLPGELEGDREFAQSIVETFRPPADPAALITPEAPPTASLAGTSAALTEVVCTVSALAANTVQMRVGPGTNRGVVAFMPSGETFTPTGLAEADDGSAWFQLSRDEVAPSSAASELWVARADVNESGNCDALNTAIAPPIVPLLGGAQPSVTAGTTEVTDAPPAAGLLTPTGGTWTLALSTETLFSCQGTATERELTANVIDNPAPITATLFVTNGGNGFTFTDLIATRRPNENTFVGSFNYDDGTNAQVYLTLEAANRFTGQFTSNAVFSGVPCSATVFVTMTR